MMTGPITIGPSAESRAQLAARATGEEIPPLILQVFEDVLAAEENIRNDKKYTDAAKQESIGVVHQAARVRFNTVFEQLEKAAQRELDAEEGKARRELLDPPPSHGLVATEGERLETIARQNHRIAALIAESNALFKVRGTRDAGELQRHFDDAQHRGLESVMAEATEQAEALAKRARSKDNSPLARDNSAVKIAIDLRARLTAFRAAHPSPSERLRAIATKRRQVTAELERKRAIWMRVYKWPDSTRQPHPAA